MADLINLGALSLDATGRDGWAVDMPLGAIALDSVSTSSGGTAIASFSTALGGLTLDAGSGVAGTVQSAIRESDLTLPVLDVVGADRNCVLPALTVSADGVGGEAGEAAFELGSVAASGSGLTGFAGSSALILPAIDAAGFDQTFKIALGSLAFSGEGIGGTVSVSQRLDLPAIEVTGVGYGATLGQAAMTIPAIEASGHGSAEVLALTSIGLPALVVSASGASGAIGSATLVLPAIESSGTGGMQIVGRAAFALPALDVAGTGGALLLGALDGTFGVALNTTSRAASTLSNVPYNSLTEFNGVLLAAGSGGLFALDADTDDGAQIDSLVRSAKTDFGTDRLKRVSAIYLGIAGENHLELTVTLDDGSQQVYMVDPASQDYVANTRAVTAKGAISRFWQWELANVDGSDFRLTDLTIHPGLVYAEARVSQFYGTVDAKYRGPMKVGLMGDTELAAEFQSRAQEMMASLINEWRSDKQVVTSAEPDSFESQGFRVAKERHEADGAVVDIKCIVNDTQRLAFINAYVPGSESSTSEDKEEEEEKKPKEEPKPYLWIGIRPLRGGWSGCYTPGWYDLAYGKNVDNWRGDDGNSDDIGYFSGIIFDGHDTLWLRPWLFEPGHKGALCPVDDWGISITGEAFSRYGSWYHYTQSGGPADPVQGLQVQAENLFQVEIDEEERARLDLNLFCAKWMCTTNGTFGSWGYFNREIDPENKNAQWWAAFWVDPNHEAYPSTKYAGPGDVDGLTATSIDGDYLLKLSGSHNWGAAPGITPQIVEVEVRTFKAPHTIKTRFLFEMTQGTNSAASYYPNGFYEAENDDQLGSNPHLPDWLTDALIVSPFKPPKLITGNIPEWGFSPGRDVSAILENSTYSNASYTIVVFKGNGDEPYRSAIAGYLASQNSKDACGGTSPMTLDEIKAKLPSDGNGIYAAEGGGFLQGAWIDAFRTDWDIGQSSEEYLLTQHAGLLAYAEGVGATQIAILSKTYTAAGGGITYIVKTAGVWAVAEA